MPASDVPSRVLKTKHSFLWSAHCLHIFSPHWLPVVHWGTCIASIRHIGEQQGSHQQEKNTTIQQTGLFFLTNVFILHSLKKDICLALKSWHKIKRQKKRKVSAGGWWRHLMLARRHTASLRLGQAHQSEQELKEQFWPSSQASSNRCLVSQGYVVSMYGKESPSLLPPSFLHSVWRVGGDFDSTLSRLCSSSGHRV